MLLRLQTMQLGSALSLTLSLAHRLRSKLHLLSLRRFRRQAPRFLVQVAVFVHQDDLQSRLQGYLLL
jgi:hypothetical protein